jgi:hypothetical protein
MGFHPKIEAQILKFAADSKKINIIVFLPLLL